MSEMTDAAESSVIDEVGHRPTKGRLFADCVILGLTAWGGFMALLAQAQRDPARLAGFAAEVLRAGVADA